jgi:hypothetical protein
MSDNFLSCPDPTDWNLLGVVGDYTRNLCFGGGLENEYPADVANSACTSVFPFLSAPCRRIEILKCNSGCERTSDTNLSIHLVGQLPADPSRYTVFSLVAGNSTYDCLNDYKYV